MIMCKNLKIETKDWRKLLIRGANELGIPIKIYQVRSMELHAKEMLNWNKVFNLTSIIEPLEVLVKHFLDSIALAPFIAGNARILDIGSGAGFPGIPLKIVLPASDITMMDSSIKKKSFLNRVIRILGVTNISAIHDRCELANSTGNYKQSFDVVVCRAFTDLKSFIKIADPFLSKNGIIIALKGKLDNRVIDGINVDTIFDNNNNFFSIRVHSYFLPFIKSQRSLIFIQKI